MEKPIKIGIIGPESTGKSVLARQLAQHYKCSFVPEFAREYLSQLNRKYTLEDVLYIADQQLLLEQKTIAESAEKIIFCDTTLITLKIWLQVVFGLVPDEFIIKMQEKENYDFYLLTDIDMPWEPDPLREHPQFRKELLEMNQRELQLINADFTLISGIGTRRFKSAVSFTNKKLNLSE